VPGRSARARRRRGLRGRARGGIPDRPWPRCTDQEESERDGRNQKRQLRARGSFGVPQAKGFQLPRSPRPELLEHPELIAAEPSASPPRLPRIAHGCDEIRSRSAARPGARSSSSRRSAAARFGFEPAMAVVFGSPLRIEQDRRCDVDLGHSQRRAALIERVPIGVADPHEVPVTTANLVAGSAFRHPQHAVQVLLQKARVELHSVLRPTKYRQPRPRISSAPAHKIDDLPRERRKTRASTAPQRPARMDLPAADQNG
jgi:hypothetical protein